MPANRPTRIDITDKAGIIARLLKNRAIEPCGCWLWTGYISKGYGRLTISGKVYNVHRVALYAYKNISLEDPKVLALHALACTNKNCFNPEHLYVGDHEQNMMNYRTAVLCESTFKNCGHDKFPENTFENSEGTLICRQCSQSSHREATRRYRAKNKEAIQ